jgi:hypothetical protein
MSTRTVVRDRIVAEFETMKEARSGRVTEFDVSLRWLTETETKRGGTYCVIVTDEQRTSQTLRDDAYQLSGAVVLYAQDSKDARAKMDLMIEDALDVLRRAFQSLQGEIQKAAVESITTTEASTAEGDWPQAVIRWSAVHRRAVMV